MSGTGQAENKKSLLILWTNVKHYREQYFYMAWYDFFNVFARTATETKNHTV
jgi:hypothetical protein